MNHDGHINQAERDAGQRCKDQLRLARAALREARVAAEQAGFGGLLLQHLEELVKDVNHVRSEYDLV